jgi:SAM-dependent methyltransferase
MRIQENITIRSLELLNLKNREGLILDAGAGPGFAAIYLNGIGYKTVAIDIIPAFLNFYKIREINPIISDMCFPAFKQNTFNAIISISSLQWIYREINNSLMKAQLIKLAKSFYEILKPKKKAVFQFYPKNNEILEDIGKIFINNTKFNGNIIIDNPNKPKKRKIYLVLKKEI